MQKKTPEEAPGLYGRLRTLRRHGRFMLAVFGGVFLLLMIGTALWPRTYRATATILIEQQEIPQELVRSTITSFADQRVQVISQRVMTGQNLMRIVQAYDLYPTERRTASRERVIERMRDDIRLKLISANELDPRSGHPTQATLAFTLSYDSRVPELALKVANELTSLYLNGNISLRNAAAQQSTSFLAQQADHLKAEIHDISERIAAFKGQHVGSLPELAQLNFQILDRTQLELRDVRNRITALDEQRVLLDAQLLQMSPTSQMFSETGQRILSPADRLKQLKADLAELTARYGPEHPDVKKVKRSVAGLETQVSADGSANDLLRELEDAQAKLAEYRKRYSQDHPDVIRWSKVVASLEQQIANAPASERVRQARTNPDNPAYIQLKAQRDAIMSERSSLDRKVAELDARTNEYQRKMAQAPEVERDYRVLLRDYDSASQKYQETREKLNQAQSSVDLEVERKGERFTLIEPPQPPEQPVSPNLPVVLALSLVVSVALSLMTVAVRDAQDVSIRGAADIYAILGVMPLAAIPIMKTSAEIAHSRRLVWLVIKVTFAVLVCGLLLVHFFIKPIDVAALSFMRRMGL